MSLTAAQERVYHKMLNRQDTGISYRQSCTAYQVGATMRTMDCLERKGITWRVEYKNPPGTVFSPITSIHYRAARATA